MSSEVGAFVFAVAAVLLGVAMLWFALWAVMLIAHVWRKLRDE